MAISYKELFDFDGLDAAFKDLEQSENQFAKAVFDDLKRIQKQSGITKSELQKLADALKGINVTNTTGRDRLSQLAADSEKVTAAFLAQNEAMNAGKNITAAVKEEIARLKAEQQALKNATEESRAKSAEFKAENERLKTALQALRNELAAAKLSQQQFSQESEKSKVAQQKLREEILKAKLEDQKASAEKKKLSAEAAKLAAAVKAAGSSVKVAAGSYKEAQQRLTALGNSIKNSENGFKSTNPEILKQIAHYNALNNALKKFDAQMGNHQRNVGNYASGVDGLIGKLGGLASGYLSAGAALSYAFSTSMSIDAIKTSMTFILGSSDAATEKLEMLRKTADRLGLEYVSLAGSYKSFVGAAVASNYPLKEADRIFNSVANAGGKLKLSTDQINGALTALQQMISKGNVQAEELRGQLGERLPGAFAIAARAMGVTSQELDKMLKNGEVLASDMLPKLATELDKTFKNDQTEKVSSLQAAVNRLKNTFSIAVENGNISKFFQLVVEGADASAGAIKSLVESKSWKAFFSRLSVGITGNNSYMADTMDEIYRVQKMTDAQRAVDVFRLSSPSKQKTMIADQTNLRDKAYEQATQLGASKETIANANKEQAVLVALRKAYDDLNGAKSETVKTNKILADSELTSVTEIRKRIAELNKLEGSAIKGTEIYERIHKLKAMLNDLNNTKAAKDSIALLEEQIQKMERAIQIQALAAKNKGMDFAPSKEALKQIDELKEKLQYVRDILNGVNRNKLGTLTEASKTSSSSLSTNIKIAKPDLQSMPALFAMSDSQISDAMTEAISKGQKKLTEIYAKEIERRNDLAAKAREKLAEAEHAALNIMELSWRNTASIIGDEWSDMFYSMTDAMHHFVEKSKDGLDDFKLSFEDFANIANGLIMGVSNTVKSSTEARITALETERDREITAAGDNANAKVAIEEAYNKKIAVQKRKAAIQEKEMALLSIAVNTAAAVMSVLSTGGGAHYLDFGVSAGILSAFVTGVGIAQAALVLAKPIPQFYTGTENAPEGVAELAERGPELQINPDGSKELNTKRQYKYLKRGTKIKNASDTTNWLSAQNLFVDRNGNLSTLSNSDELSANMHKMNNYHYVMMNSNSEKFDYDRMGKMFEKSVSSIPFDQHYFDDRGYSNYRVESNTRIKNLNAVNSRKGNG